MGHSSEAGLNVYVGPDLQRATMWYFPLYSGRCPDNVAKLHIDKMITKSWTFRSVTGLDVCGRGCALIPSFFAGFMEGHLICIHV